MQTSSFPVIINVIYYVFELQVLVKKAAFADDSEVEEASIYLYEAKDENGNWLSRTVSDLSTFEKIQNSTEDKICRKALQATLKLKDVFHSFCHEDLNVLVMTAPVFVVAPCSEHWHLTEHYRAVAETLEMQSGVTELVGDIERVSTMGAGNPFITPFVVLENSSGTGKTQMAFTLMAQKDVQVFYVSCGESQSAARHAFMRRSKSFLRCIEEDLPKVDDARMFFVFPQLQLHTFGFICALLTGRSSFIEPKGPESVRKELKARARGRRNCVIFLDEFPRVNNEHPVTSEPAIRLMLNVFRAFGLAVILSTTSATARDLATMDAGRYLQQSGGLWCVVRPSLPPFECSSRKALTCDLQKTIDNSRPSFAAFAAKYSTEHALGHDVVEYTDRMAAALADTIGPRERFSSEAFRVGQTCILLGASYGDDDLVDNSAKFDDAGRLISDHFARLRERKAFELILGNENNPSKFADGKVPWKCQSELPTPKEDPLLHLCLSGGKDFCALRDSSSTPVPFTRAFAETESAGYSVLSSLKDNESAYKMIRLEMLIAGAIVVSSHRNGLAGIAFPTFFSALLYELGIQSSPDLQLKFPANAVGTVLPLTIPFLAPPKLE
ncbi:uncharacterized protein KRP23_9187 [Phytophthora ramorum]|uniref:uncharacterized protein n=1 Tax=Phytophthora ramorum TaxID=164328 RepID=UPI0030B599AE|nr:hypothetical protein KRP23_9187 [Phytophthora ramorum]